MRLIGAGFGRTGTMSLKAALEHLGYGPCLHMIDILGEPSLASPWLARSRGEAVDWRAALAGWNATVDWPGCSFWLELADAWPDAPVLLNVRDPDAWYESCLKTIHAVNDPQREPVAGGGPAHEMIQRLIWSGTFESWEAFKDRDYAEQIMLDHDDAVRAAIAPERLVEFEIGEGWDALCEHLGVPVPDAPFPHLNDTDAFREMVGLPPL